MARDAKIVEDLIRRWSLHPEGAVIRTPSSDLLPVRWRGRAAMLKIAYDEEERYGARLMVWWDGDGAAQVFAAEGGALLMERAEGGGDLLAMAESGPQGDAEASRILCAALKRLHRPRGAPPEGLMPLEAWMRRLPEEAARDARFTAAEAARARLLATEREVVPLHGDPHHRNLLDFGARGWLAIDPKRAFGERSYDYVHMLCNPEMRRTPEPGRLEAQAGIVAQAAGLEKRRLLEWALAYAGLSAAWFLEDEDQEAAERELRLAVLAEAALEG